MHWAKKYTDLTITRITPWRVQTYWLVLQKTFLMLSSNITKTITPVLTTVSPPQP